MATGWSDCVLWWQKSSMLTCYYGGLNKPLFQGQQVQATADEGLQTSSIQKDMRSYKMM